MSEYIVTARKWRPLKFEDVVGQGHVTVTLRNAVETKRLAHAYLFSGPRGVGKTTSARLLAKVVNCHNPVNNNPDNECEICKEVNEGRSFDVLEIDGASNRGVEEIRSLRESVRYAPTKGNYKVYIIDEVHMLTKEAFNALLKTLEEPPPHILFIFATTEIHKVPATIVSRCQRFDFRRITVNEIITNLKTIAVEEGIHIDDDALLLIAKKGDGSLRDSQSMFDQVVSLCGKHITHAQIVQALNIVDQDIYFRVTDLIKTGNTKGGLELIEEIVGRGYDIKEFLGGLTEHLRNILIAKTTESTMLIETSEVYKKRFAEESKSFTLADILRLQRLLNGTEATIRWSAQPRFKLEADFIHMISMHRAPDVNELVQQIEALKKKLDGIDPTTNVSAKEVNGAWQKTRTKTTSDRPEQMDQSSLSSNHSSVSSEQPTVVHLSSLKEDELTVRWQEFINEVRRRRISLGLILESATLLEAGERTIRIGCANEFQASSIKKQERFLTEVLSKIFNASARLEVEIGDIYQKSAVPQRGVPEQKGGKAVEEHPVTKAIIREFGAEPL